MIRLLALAALLLAVEPANAAGRVECRFDRLGNVICIIHKAVPPRPIPRAGGFAQAAPRAALTLPSARTDAFGIARPPLRSALGARPFGQPPRPQAPARHCRRDAFGNINCR